MWRFNSYKESVAALDDMGNRIMYSDLYGFAQELSHLCPRKLSFNLCSNTIGSLAGYAAMIEAEVVPVMLPSDMDKELLADLMHRYRPDYFWIPQEMISAFQEMKPVCSRYGYVLLRTGYETGDRLYRELALLLTTSGSTGSPKLVRQSYRNIRSNTRSIVKYLELNAAERPITTLPMHYTYGLSIINTHLHVGATILVTEKPMMNKGFWEFLKEEKATSFGGVPYTYEMLKKLRFFTMEVPSVRTMTQAGGKLTPGLHREFAEFAASTDRKFIVMYGQTEATARMAYLPAEKAVEKCGSMGIAIPDGRFMLIDGTGSEIQDGDITGELVYHGDNVALGYAQQEADLSKGDEWGGMLVTGDMAKRDKDGFYYIVGRKKRFLKMFGKRVNMDEVERLVKESYLGMDCACIGVDDRMQLFVNDRGKMDDVRVYISQKAHIHRSAIKIRYLETIPKNDAGKTLYAQLQDRLGEKGIPEC